MTNGNGGTLGERAGQGDIDEVGDVYLWNGMMYYYSQKWCSSHY